MEAEGDQAQQKKGDGAVCGIRVPTECIGEETVEKDQWEHAVEDVERSPSTPDKEEEDPGAGDTGSIVIVVGTDAPLLPHQLKRLAKRAALGLGRMGSVAYNGSGDIFVAFSTANAAALKGEPLSQTTSIGNDHIDPLFAATVQATEDKRPVPRRSRAISCNLRHELGAHERGRDAGLSRRRTSPGG